MASHKNQHFVPRCYLKPFSLDGEGAAINLYNIDRRRSVENVSVKDQCSSAYFYGEDLTLEKALQEFEGMYADVLRQICKPDFALTDRHKAALRRFCYLQHCRTEALSRRTAMSMSELTDVAFGGAPPADWQINTKEIIQAQMRGFAQTAHEVDDLKVCLVRNKTRRSFITSDDPAILTNRWSQQSPKAKGQTGGAGNAGALFFLPLTPNVLCILYDGDVYSIQNEGGWVIADKFTDIEAFNEQQLLACRANSYFSRWADRPRIETAFAEALLRRPRARHELIAAVLDGDENPEWKRYRVVARDDPKMSGEAIFHIKGVELRPSRWPSIIRWRPNQKVYTNDTLTGFVRPARVENGPPSDPAYRRLS